MDSKPVRTSESVAVKVKVFDSSGNLVARSSSTKYIILPGTYPLVGHMWPGSSNDSGVLSFEVKTPIVGKLMSGNDEMLQFGPPASMKDPLYMVVSGAYMLCVPPDCARRVHGCAACGKLDARLAFCGRCRITFYCGLECQKADYATHKQSCTAPPPTGSMLKAVLSTVDNTSVTALQHYIRRSREWRRTPMQDTDELPTSRHRLIYLILSEIGFYCASACVIDPACEKLPFKMLTAAEYNKKYQKPRNIARFTLIRGNFDTLKDWTQHLSRTLSKVQDELAKLQGT